MDGILGHKLGMTQIFSEDGKAIPVTVLEVGPCRVVQRKTAETDGYEAVQVGLVEKRPVRHVIKPMAGHFAKAGVEPSKRLTEIPVPGDSQLAPGDEIKVSIFAENDFVDVIGTSKGRGFQGVVKRYNAKGGKATHGSMHHRAPGSIGQASDPSRVFPGVKLPGQMGSARVTVRNLRVVQVDEERNLLVVRGAVPGANGAPVAVRRSNKRTAT